MTHGLRLLMTHD
jgi:hypothetical protein